MEKANVKEMKDFIESTSMSLEEVRCSIKQWGEVKNIDGLSYLFSDTYFGFKITKEEFVNKLNVRADNGEDIDFIHMYIGLEDEEDKNIWFHLVDSFSDTYSSYYKGDNLLILSKNYDVEGNEFDVVFKNNRLITKREAKDRSHKWFTEDERDKWFKRIKGRVLKSGNKKENVDLSIVRVFSIPFEDFENLFNENECDSVVVFFGLYDYCNKEEREDRKHEIEVLLGGVNHKGGDNSDLFQDVSTPHPPFSISNNGFNLL